MTKATAAAASIVALFMSASCVSVTMPLGKQDIGKYRFLSLDGASLLEGKGVRASYRSTTDLRINREQSGTAGGAAGSPNWDIEFPRRKAPALFADPEGVYLPFYIVQRTPAQAYRSHAGRFAMPEHTIISPNYVYLSRRDGRIGLGPSNIVKLAALKPEDRKKMMDPAAAKPKGLGKAVGDAYYPADQNTGGVMPDPGRFFGTWDGRRMPIGTYIWMHPGVASIPLDDFLFPSILSAVGPVDGKTADAFFPTPPRNLPTSLLAAESDERHARFEVVSLASFDWAMIDLDKQSGELNIAIVSFVDRDSLLQALVSTTNTDGFDIVTGLNSRGDRIDGRLADGSYFTGKIGSDGPEGLGQRLFEDGTIQYGHFEKGKPHGIVVESRFGKILSAGRYEAGAREGLHAVFDDSGRPVASVAYRAGESLERRGYVDPSGSDAWIWLGGEPVFAYRASDGARITAWTSSGSGYHASVALPDGSIASGSWEAGAVKEGILAYPDGSFYKGGMADFRPEGKGVLTKGASVYEGEWKAGKLNGDVVVSAKGDRVVQMFRDGEPVRRAGDPPAPKKLGLADWLKIQNDAYWAEAEKINRNTVREQQAAVAAAVSVGVRATTENLRKTGKFTEAELADLDSIAGDLENFARASGEFAGKALDAYESARYRRDYSKAVSLSVELLKNTKYSDLAFQLERIAKPALDSYLDVRAQVASLRSRAESAFAAIEQARSTAKALSAPIVGSAKAVLLADERAALAGDGRDFFYALYGDAVAAGRAADAALRAHRFHADEFERILNPR